MEVDQPPYFAYEMSLCYRATWQAHSLSNAGSNGSNRLMPRRQLLADGTETDACSGNIAKHHHAKLLAEYCAAQDLGLCPACAVQDGRRAAALIQRPEYKDWNIERILSQCALCDTHGFLITSRNASSDGTTEARQRVSKHSLVEFAFALALPDTSYETSQLTTRVGDSKDEGQMLMKMVARSGTYAMCIRYACVGVGVDTERWRVIITEQPERQRRHQAILMALRDYVLSPSGAMTASMLPHLTGLKGVIVMRMNVGRAPLYSPLAHDFVERLEAMHSPGCQVLPFASVDGFHQVMETLIVETQPCMPQRRSTQGTL